MKNSPASLSSVTTHPINADFLIFQYFLPNSCLKFEKIKTFVQIAKFSLKMKNLAKIKKLVRKVIFVIFVKFVEIFSIDLRATPNWAARDNHIYKITPGGHWFIPNNSWGRFCLRVTLPEISKNGTLSGLKFIVK